MAARQARSRRFWFDPRFAIGLGLIAVSVVGTVLVVGAADSSTEVLAAREALTPGETVTADDLVVDRVGLNRAGVLYLSPDDVPDAGLVVTRTVAAGELVPASAVGSVDGLDSTTIVVTVQAPLPASVTPGATVDVWAAAAAEGGGFAPPVVISPAATVVHVTTASGIVVDSAGGSVELLVPKDTVARLLEAVANKDALSLVPASVPAGG